MSPTPGGEAPRITMAHGGGGRSMQRLIREVLLPAYGDPQKDAREDQARLALDEHAAGGKLAFTTDSYVVDPLFFPGGDIGALAVNGTLNDLACGGARPTALSCSLILEEGLEISVLRQVAESIGRHTRAAGVPVVTGDTKVVARGAADRLFINTAGVGWIPAGRNLSSASAQAGDVVVVNGSLGNHGAAVLCARGDLSLQSAVQSDTRALHTLIERLLSACPGVRCIRDATRGGVAGILNEIAEASGVCIRLREESLPVDDATRGVCELLGLEPLYLANEGIFAAVLPEEEAPRALALLQDDPAGTGASLIGRVEQGSVGLVLDTLLGGTRVLDTLSGEQLPRIC